MKTKRIVQYFILIVLSILLAACAAEMKYSRDNRFAENFHVSDPGKKILVLPFEATYSEFAQGEVAINQELSIQIKRAGYQPVFLDQKRYQDIWDKEVAAAGGVYNPKTGAFLPDAYVRALVGLMKQVTTADEYSLMLVPRIVRKTATFSGGYAVWDGVTRTQDTTAFRSMTYDGTTAGLSLKLIAIGSEGEWQATTFGGILLPYRVNVQKRKNEWRENLFSEPEEIQEAVSLVLNPLLKNTNAVAR